MEVKVCAHNIQIYELGLYNLVEFQTNGHLYRLHMVFHQASHINLSILSMSHSLSSVLLNLYYMAQLNCNQVCLLLYSKHLALDPPTNNHQFLSQMVHLLIKVKISYLFNDDEIFCACVFRAPKV